MRKVVRELAERPDWNVDRQTDRWTAFQLYIYIDKNIANVHFVSIAVIAAAGI